MPDSIGPNGLVVETATEITALLTTGLQGIYGADINVDQNSPDGQLVGIITQAGVDLRELIADVNNAFDPDNAQGGTLDQRCAINNIQRTGGTYTIQPMTINVNATVKFQGLDAAANDPRGTGFTVQDGSGNMFILLDTVTLTGNTANINFRAQKIGAVNVPINTITNPVTIIPGVTSVNNPSSAISVGQAQELDPQLRTRRQASVGNSANGYLNGLRGALLALSGVTQAEVYENDTGTTDANGTSPYSIWVIVSGGANTDIANTIYARKTDGAPMRGGVSVNIITASGALFVAKFDRPIAVNLYLQFTLKRTVPGYVFDPAAIKASMATGLVYRIGQFAETSSVTDAAEVGIASQGGGGVPLLAQISSDGVTWVNYLDAPTLASEWTLDPSRITITVI